MIKISDYQGIFSAAGFARQHLAFTPDLQQECVLDSRSRRGIICCPRQWGKSTVTAAMAMHQAYFHPRSLVIVVSPSERQSSEFLRKAETFAAQLNIDSRGDGSNAVSLLLPNQSRLVGLPGVEATTRGFSKCDLLIVDEAARVADATYLALRPMLAMSRGRLWMLSTPYGQRGFFWKTWKDSGQNWQRITVRATDCPRYDPAFLAEERREMGDRWFRQEYLCEFVSTENSVFNMEDVERAFSDEVKPLLVPEWSDWRP